jgi:transcriptional regulator with XRE-family HTH domain
MSSDPKERLAAWRQDSDTTLGALAEKLGCSPEFVGMVERGKRRPGLRFAVRLAAATEEWEHGPIAAKEWDAAATSDETEAA